MVHAHHCVLSSPCTLLRFPQRNRDSSLFLQILLRSLVTNFTFTHSLSLLRPPSSLPPSKQRKILLYSSNDLFVFQPTLSLISFQLAHQDGWVQSQNQQIIPLMCRQLSHSDSLLAKRLNETLLSTFRSNIGLNCWKL